MTSRLNYWRLLAQEQEQEAKRASEQGDIARALRSTMLMAQALEQARITDEREE